jgi:cytochrome c-type biogenesis protein CcmH
LRTLLAVLAALALAAPAAIAATPQTTLNDVEDEVMCVQCGTALNISQAPSADRERAFIRRRIAEGKTKAQIKAELVQEYGRNVLATPPSRGFDIANWLVPVGLAVLAVLALVATARRWRRSGAQRDAEQPVDLPAEDAARLERDMAAYDL